MPAEAVYIAQPTTDDKLVDSGITATAGTPKPLSATSVPCITVLIQVKQANIGKIFIGGSTVPNTGASGIVLEVPTSGITPPAISFSARNLNQVYINPAVTGNGVNFIYW